MGSFLLRRRFASCSKGYVESTVFLEAGKNVLTEDTLRDASSDGVRQLKAENEGLEVWVCER